MFDEALYAPPTRMAMEGEQLVLHKFATGAIGIVPAAELALPAQPLSLWQRIERLLLRPTTPLCVTPVRIPPGAYLILNGIPGNIQQRWGLHPQEGAVFIQTAAGEINPGDALRFCNGAEIQIQNLRQGIQVEVLSFGGTAAEKELLMEAA